MLLHLKEKSFMSDKENPFASSGTPKSSSRSPGSPPLKEDIEGNLALTAKIAKISAGVYVFLAALYGFTWFRGFKYLMPLEMGITWIHIIHVFRASFGICFLLLAWRGWIYGNSIKNIPIDESAPFAKHVENLTWLWLAIGLMVFLQLASTALNITATYSSTGDWY